MSKYEIGIKKLKTEIKTIIYITSSSIPPHAFLLNFISCFYRLKHSGLPLGKNAPIEGSLEILVEEASSEPSGPMDWTNFDFSKDDAFNSANDPIAQEALDVDTFFKKLDGSAENEDVEVGIEEEVI